jgi:stage II sporulation protein D
MDVINVVNLDQYVAGVLPGELYANWHEESFRAGAVAARTYALWQMAKNSHRGFDVRATEASQVYGGIPTGPAARKARDAVMYTRGVVCTWSSPQGERIFCTFYSSACGGCTQSVSNILDAKPIPPLSGGVHCDYCRIAQRKGNAYRWGPSRISKAKLAQRLARRYPSLRSVGAVDRVEVASRGTASGRPAAFRVVGSNGRSQTLKSEEFRLAVGSRTMRSSDCTIENGPDEIRFTKGRGFGHGVGLCQWGMEGQALLGRTAGQILKFYYPEMNLTRAY